MNEPAIIDATAPCQLVGQYETAAQRFSFERRCKRLTGRAGSVLTVMPDWLTGNGSATPALARIRIARTVRAPLATRIERIACPSDRYLFIVALEPTDAEFSQAGHTFSRGPMPSGTLLVVAPGKELVATISGSSDFLHFLVPERVVAGQFVDEGFGPPSRLRGLQGFVTHDPLIEQISRFLIDGPCSSPRDDADILGHLLVTRFMKLLPRRSPKTALPIWRLKKVEQLVESFIDAPLRLKDLAAAAGLSRMHFAAQFRAATGYRPHAYVLARRIERAKTLIEGGDIALVDVALDVGFQSQAHFCTIFKRMTGMTPSAWRSRSAVEPQDAVQRCRLEVAARDAVGPVAARSLASPWIVSPGLAALAAAQTPTPRSRLTS